MHQNFVSEIRSVINQNVLYAFLVLMSLVCLIYLQFYKIPNDYSLIRIMPAVYLLVLILFIKPSQMIGFATIILVVMYFIKICIVAIVCAWGNFYSQISASLVIPYWNKACVYQGIEWLLVALSINTTQKLFRNKISAQGFVETSNIEENNNHNSFIRLFIILSVLFCAFIAVAFPDFGYKISILALNNTSYRPPSGQGAPFYLFRLVFEIARPLLFFLIFSDIEKSPKLKDTTKIFLQVIIIFLCAIIMSEERILSLTSTLAMLIMLMMKRVNQHKFVIRLLQVVVVILAVLLVMNLTLHNDALSYTWKNICRLFNIYLGGYIITAAGFNVQLNNGFQMFLNDVVDSTLLPALVGHQYSTTDAINEVMNLSAKGTFFEMIVQARAMFGILFPVAIYVLIYFVEKLDYHRTIDIDVLHQLIFLFCGTTAALFVVMYTYTMTFNFLLNKALIFLILVLIDNKVIITYQRKPI